MPEFPQLRISLGSSKPSIPLPITSKVSPSTISVILTPKFLRQFAVDIGSSEFKKPLMVVCPYAILPKISALWDIDLSPGTSTIPCKLPPPSNVRELFIMI